MDAPPENPLPTSPRAPSSRIPALDGLRGVAALMVLFHHTLLLLPDYANYEWFGPKAPSHGWVEFALLRTPLRLLWAGQERALLFFVLSGFVLCLPWLAGRPQPYGKFLLGRFCRIYPPYLIAMGLAALGSVLLGGHDLPNASIYVRQLGWVFQPDWQAAPSIAFVLNNRHSAFINEAVWSLVWEVRVALIFPLMIVPMVRWSNAGAAAVFVALLAARHFASGLLPPSWSETLNVPQESFYYAQYFVFGAWVALNRAAIAAWFARHSAAGATILALGCLICWLPWPVQHDRIVGLGAAIIIAAIAADRRVQSWLARSSLIWLGRQSYSLYLIHVPVIMAAAVIFDGSVPLWACAAIAPVSIGLAELFHQYLELPSVALAQRLTSYSRRGPAPPATVPQEQPAIAAPAR